MTRTEFIQQALLRAWAMHARVGSKFDLSPLVEFVDALEKSGLASWSDEPETARESFVRGTEVGHVEAKKTCAQILQSDGIEALVHHLGIVGWVVENGAAGSIAVAVQEGEVSVPKNTDDATMGTKQREVLSSRIELQVKSHGK